MKKALFLLVCILFTGMNTFCQFAINTDDSDPHSSAMLDVKSTNKGILIPRMTIMERDAIQYPANGLMVYCIDCGINGSLSIFSNNVWRTFSPCSNSVPVQGTHIPNNTSITWVWNPVPDALGYKWSVNSNYQNAIDVGQATTYYEGNLVCGTAYARQIWAYNSCGISVPVLLTQSTTGTISTPTPGIIIPDFYSIEWKWTGVQGADGYKWNSVNDISTAIDLGTGTSYIQTNLLCNTDYTSYVWSYNSCGVSNVLTLPGSTLPAPPAPAAGVHTQTYTTIVWNWLPVAGAIGYKWNTVNDYSTATDMGTSTSKSESGLVCGTEYSRFVWSYNTCGQSLVLSMTHSTQACFVCGSDLVISHVTSGGVAPVDKTVTYGTVTNVPGETTKCWITRNLGASQQPTANNDATEASAGWYWQFNKKQGYKYEGTTRTPSSTWITSINESTSWVAANDPCTIEIGNGWRLPTNTEWTNVDGTAGGNWTNWNGPYNSLLKMHAAGQLLYSSGNLQYRGATGYYWSATQMAATMGYQLLFNSTSSASASLNKAYGNTLRCIK